MMNNILRFSSKKELMNYFCVEHVNIRFEATKQYFIDDKLLDETVYPLVLALKYQGADANTVGFGYKYVKVDKTAVEEEYKRLKEDYENLIKMFE